MAKKKVIETEIVLVDSSEYYVDMDVEGKYCFTIMHANGRTQTTCMLEAAALCVNNRKLPVELYSLPMCYNQVNIESVLMILSGYAISGEEWIVEWHEVADECKNKFFEKIEKIYYTCNSFGELVDSLAEHFNMSVMLDVAMENNYRKI